MLKMMLWLVGLGLALFCTVNAESECSIDHHEMQGKMFVTAMASDCPYILEHKDMIKIVPVHLSLTNDNKLKVITSFFGKNGCRKLEMEFTKLSDGTYFYTSERSTTKKVEVVATDCKTFAMVHATMEYDGKTSNHLVIYTRERELPLELREKFEESARNSGFTSDQTVFPHEVACEDKA